MCLSCSGVHRGLGVHISFIRSITMDAFKGSELVRMAAGGNKPFQDFFNTHPSNTKDGRTFEASSISERYDSEAGDEWKERLSCKVEDREFDKSNLPKRLPKKDNASAAGAGAPLSGRASAAGSRSQTPLGKTRSNDPGFQRSGSDSWKKDDEPGAPPALDDFQKDPLAALTKGFGWLGASVSKVGKTGYEGYVKPGMAKVCLTISSKANTTKVTNNYPACRGRPRIPSSHNRWHPRPDPSIRRRKRKHAVHAIRRRRFLNTFPCYVWPARTRAQRLLGELRCGTQGPGEG